MMTMKLTTMGLAAMVAAGACITPDSSIGSAAGRVGPIETAPSSIEMESAYAGTLEADVSANMFDVYARSIDERLPSGNLLRDDMLTLVETPLGPGSFADVTSEEWMRMDSYFDGMELRKIGLIPFHPNTATQELYFHDGKLVSVFYKPQGMTRADSLAPVERFYFGKAGLVTWIRDGMKVPESDPDFYYWSDQLLREAERYSRGF